MDKQRYGQKHISVGLQMEDALLYTPTPKAQVLLDVLHQGGVWMSRSQLAEQIDKKILNKWDIILLSKMADTGLIEMRQIPHHGPIGYEWQYRALSNNQS